MTRKLPVVRYKRKNWFVDFRLKELRRVTDMKTLKFKTLKGKNSILKPKLRRLRFEHWKNDYIEGVDD